MKPEVNPKKKTKYVGRSLSIYTTFKSVKEAFISRVERMSTVCLLDFGRVSSQ